jgi:adenylate kinase family enzyme
MKKILLLGRGGAGKSTAAERLGKITHLPVIELDKHFWQSGLTPLGREQWKSVQRKLTSGDGWIMDGDLGKYDVLSERLKLADTIIILNFSLWTSFGRAFKRSKERIDFWWWLVTWRLLELPKIKNAIKMYAPQAKVFIFRNPRRLEEFMDKLATTNHE